MNEYIRTNSIGSKYYYKDKEKTIRHREDGPAVEYSFGSKSWWLNNKLHRTDGPAVDVVNGIKAWVINGVLIFAIDNSGKIIDRME